MSFDNISIWQVEECILIFYNLYLGESPISILNEDAHPVVRAIGVLNTACKHEFRQNARSHSRSVFLFL